MRTGSDVAISDIAGTLLMVGAVVMAGGALTLVVANELGTPAPPVADFALAPASQGDSSLRLILQNGETLQLADLTLSLTRGSNPPTVVPRAQWTTPDVATLRPGETLAVPLVPPAVAGERMALQVVSTTANALIARESISVPAAASPMSAPPSLVSSLTPASIRADGVTSALLAVRVAHPSGGLGVARINVDLRNLSAATGLAATRLDLADDGSGGDALGGDGIWSGLVRPSANATPGNYNLTIYAIDLAGLQANSTWANLTITSNLTALVGNVTGNCIGCAVGNGTTATLGTRLNVPTSANVTTLRLTNWTWDRLRPERLASDVLVIRVTDNTYTWSARFTLAYSNSIPSITALETWNANATTTYAPTANGRVPLANLDLNLLNPTTSGFTCVPSCPTPMRYANANIRDSPSLLVAWMGEDSINARADDVGLFSVDVVVS